MNDNITTPQENAIQVHNPTQADLVQSPPDVTPASISASEVPLLAEQLASAHRKAVALHGRHFGLSTEEADAQVSKPAHEIYQQHVLSMPPDQVSWTEINTLMHTDANLACQRVETIRQAALLELRTGHRSANALAHNGNASPWDQAEFIAVLDELAADWKPRTGVERLLLHQAALAHSQMLYWLGVLSERSQTICEEQPETRRRDRWKAPRVSEADAIDQAATMADRFERMFLRCIRSLTDLRKTTIIVQQATNVNVAERQVNITNNNVGQAAPDAIARAASMATLGD